MTEKRRYTTKAVNTGGRHGISRLIDGSFEVDVAMPKEMGGPGEAVNPEQLFALGWSACFHSALERHKKTFGAEGESKVGIEIGLNTDPEFGGFKLVANIEVGIEGLSLTEVQEIADQAHGDCAYSKATRGNIDSKVTAIETFFIEDVNN
ncbi:MAG: organic hydroperoxide resistance protein [Ruoffia tabacinasalis]|uniref:organic hydroperoxide resistance protein n=1 Tax=Ruoffia sp. FAM 26255 TaxID=3259519 RepID=UPI003889EB4D